MNKSIRFQNFKNLHFSQHTNIFDLTKLEDYPLRILYIEKNKNHKKALFYKDVGITEFFPIEGNETVKYVLIGNTNRTNLSSEYIVETVEELYNAIQKYIAASLGRRFDPLEYYFIIFTKIYDLRAYKRLFAKDLPILLRSKNI
ncbi:MAG: hypothetical protein GPJ54_21640 [Candidatus Heimdallarchaeota archaeon]|nr:hypothetical protein [Candidatus Heimdallarchaeota archaeon]